MVGMLQIIAYLLAFYLVVKGIEILQIALASQRVQRGGIIAAIAFVHLQDQQAMSVSNNLN